MNRALPPARAWMAIGGTTVLPAVVWCPLPDTPTVIAGQMGPAAAVTGDLVAVDAFVADPEWQEIADVIFHTGEFSDGETTAWLGQTLLGFPGCAVAATWLDRGICAAATRRRYVFIPVSGMGRPGIRLLACAAFVQGWLAAQWPSTILATGKLDISERSLAQARNITRGVMRLSFSIFYSC